MCHDPVTYVSRSLHIRVTIVTQTRDDRYTNEGRSLHRREKTTLERQVVRTIGTTVAPKRVLRSLGLPGNCAWCRTYAGCGSYGSSTELSCDLSRLSACVHGIRIDVIALIAVDIIEIAILPRTGIDVKPYMHRVALMNVHLLQTVSTEDTEKAGARILILGLNDKLLRLPRITRALRDSLFGGIFLNNHSFHFYSL